VTRGDSGMSTSSPERGDDGQHRYHRLARIGRHRWWKPLVELVLLVLLSFPLSMMAVIPWFVFADAQPDGAFGLLVLGTEIAVLLPAALLAARIIRGRWRTLLSVDGVLRGRWFAVCLAVAVVDIVLAAVVDAAIAASGAPLTPAHGEWVGWARFLPLALAVVVAVVPQAAAEEVVFRGTLVQAIGSWARPAWIAVLLSSAVFGLAHGLEPPILVATGALGVVCAWLTIRTGGLEAAIALHVMNNVSAFLADAATGRSDRWVTEMNVDVGWPEALVGVSLAAVYAGAVATLHARRRGAVRDHTLAPPPLPVVAADP
jgi:uncharacterized protein